MAPHSLKERTRDILIRTVNRFGISSKYIGTPKTVVSTAGWTAAQQGTAGVFFKEVYPAKDREEQPPVTLEGSVHRIYANEYRRSQPQAFVAGIGQGRIWGRNGAVITSDDALIGDISREFGRYGGILNDDHSIFRQVKLSKVRRIDGRVAVVASAGSQNYHHWLYDTLPRIGLLKKTGLIDTIDHLVIDYSGLKFQKDSLEVLGIPAEKIIACNDHWNFHIQADELIVTSLPARLGTVSEWTVEFLRETFLPDPPTTPRQRIYLSRRKAPSRNLVNEAEVLEVLRELNFRPFYPEDFSIRETAAVFATADAIAGVHGSGFANLAFCSPGTKVVDILAPKHLDPYYWILANLTGSTYGYIVGKGERLPEDTDLVRNKIDEDIQIDITEFFRIVKKLAISSE